MFFLFFLPTSLQLPKKHHIRNRKKKNMAGWHGTFLNFNLFQQTLVVRDQPTTGGIQNRVKPEPAPLKPTTYEQHKSRRPLPPPPPRGTLCPQRIGQDRAAWKVLKWGTTLLCVCCYCCGVLFLFLFLFYFLSFSIPPLFSHQAHPQLTGVAEVELSHWTLENSPLCLAFPIGLSVQNDCRVQHAIYIIYIIILNWAFTVVSTKRMALGNTSPPRCSQSHCSAQS